MNKKTILLVEDEPGLVLTLGDLFTAEGWNVEHRGDYAGGKEAAEAGIGDIIILDLNLPGGPGLDILRDMRARADRRPVLVLSAKGSIPDRVVGLKLGADDYLAKPFDSMELLARIEALVRRIPSKPADKGVLSFGDLVIDTERSETKKDGTVLPLTVQEYRLLLFLYSHRGKTLSRERLLEEVWGYDSEVNSRTIDVHISSLRHKIGDDPQKPKWIITVRGFGYRLEDEE